MSKQVFCKDCKNYMLFDYMLFGFTYPYDCKIKRDKLDPITGKFTYELGETRVKNRYLNCMFFEQKKPFWKFWSK